MESIRCTEYYLGLAAAPGVGELSRLIILLRNGLLDCTGINVRSSWLQGKSWLCHGLVVRTFALSMVKIDHRRAEAKMCSRVEGLAGDAIA